MSAFLRGFADGASLVYDHADEQWAAWSHQMSDAARKAVERGGYANGLKEGKTFAVHFRGVEGGQE